MKPALQFLLGLSLGISVIWIAQTPTAPSQESTPPPKTRQPRSPSSSRLHLNSTATQQAEKNYLALTDKNNDKPPPLTKLSTSDLQNLILHLLTKTDPLTGMNYPDRNHLEEAIQQLAKLDLPATCQWIDNTFPEKLRNTFYKDVIDSAFKDKPLEALDFAKQHLDTKNVSRVAGTLFITTDPLTTEVANALVANSLFDSGSTGSSSDFSDDFDFLTFAQTSLDQVKSHNHKSPSSFPTNLYTEWAMRHPAEAMEFYNTQLKGQKADLPFNDLGKIITGYLNVAESNETTPWLTELLRPDVLPSPDRKKAMNTILLSKTTSKTQIKEIARQLDLPPQQTLDFYASISNHSGNKATSARLTALELFSSPRDRITALTEKIKSNGYSFGLYREARRRELTYQLKSLGHSDSEISQVLAGVETK